MAAGPGKSKKAGCLARLIHKLLSDSKYLMPGELRFWYQLHKPSLFLCKSEFVVLQPGLGVNLGFESSYGDV